MWSELFIDDVSKEICKGIEKKMVSTSNTMNESLDINEILKKDPTTINELTSLEYQAELAQTNKDYLKEGRIEMNLLKCMDNLRWIFNSSSYLGKKYNMKELHHLNSSLELIPRNSYRFCENNYKCFIDKKKKCLGQHFVYNLVKADIDSILYYMNNCISNKTRLNSDELGKSINTISFVINHMLDEKRKLESNRKKISLGKQ
jgi:hypothetical protein